MTQKHLTSYVNAPSENTHSFLTIFLSIVTLMLHTAGSEPREKRDFEKLRHSYLITFVLTCLLKTYDEKALYIYLFG